VVNVNEHPLPPIEPSTLSEPPDMVRLDRALRRTPADGGMMRALHLALPVDVAAQVAVELTSTAMTWRGVTVARSGDDAFDAARLALLGRREGDRFLDLEDTPDRWVKVIHSGHRKIAFGATLMLGLPSVVADVRVEDRTVRSVVRGLAAGEVRIGEVTDSGVVVTGGRKMLMIRPAAAQRRRSKLAGDDEQGR
jgi:hypothetical protein